MYYHRICYFPVMGVKRGACVSKEKGDVKRKGELIHLSVLCLQIGAYFVICFEILMELRLSDIYIKKP